MSFGSLRLTRELAKLKEENIEGVNIIPTENILIWEADIEGPVGTPFEEGIFRLSLKFSNDYPLVPPSVKFITDIYHPNVYKDGKICVDILQSEWSPGQNISSILISIRSLLIDPNPNSPANRDAAVIFLRNRNEYDKRVKERIFNRIV